MRGFGLMVVSFGIDCGSYCLFWFVSCVFGAGCFVDVVGEVVGLGFRGMAV